MVLLNRLNLELLYDLELLYGSTCLSTGLVEVLAFLASQKHGPPRKVCVKLVRVRRQPRIFAVLFVVLRPRLNLEFLYDLELLYGSTCFSAGLIESHTQTLGDCEEIYELILEDEVKVIAADLEILP